MLIEDVKKLTPIERFWYWIKERHSIYIKREKKKLKPPWTDDEVLQSYFFTNPYRENDKTTVWFRDNIRNPMYGDDSVLLATVIFRWFNRIETGEFLIENNLLEKWDSKKTTKMLEEYARENNCPVFTGAYMIKAGNGPPGCKIGNVCRAIDNVKKKEKSLIKNCSTNNSLHTLWKSLKEFPHLGGFMSYEVVCDLRYTHLLEDATDINTWANPGPGALRGLARLNGIRLDKRIVQVGKLPVSPLHEMQRLLKQSKITLRGLPKFELREIEHSCCEWDKYERALWKDGRLKRNYHGAGH